MPKSPGWHYDEMRHVGADYNDSARVEDYDRQMAKVRDLRREIEEIVAALEIRPEHTIVEIGSGTSEVTAALAPLCRDVHAVDVSPAMIEMAWRKLEARGIRNVHFENAGFLTNGVAPDSADAVVSQLALHHLPEFWKQVALQRVFASLKPGGRFYLHDMVFSFDPASYADYFPRIVAQVRELAGDELATTWKSASARSSSPSTPPWRRSCAAPASPSSALSTGRGSSHGTYAAKFDETEATT